MATFSYRCPVDGSFDLHLPIGTATSFAECPRCGSDASRVYTVPMIAAGDRTRRALIEHSEKTRFEPDVVSGAPPARHRPGAAPPAASRNPAWDRLPRP